jgi:hypothetical protein
MTFRRAAALALVGWFLMSPPVLGVQPRLTFSAEAQLRKWKVVQGFDKATDCNQALTRRIMDCGNCPFLEFWLAAQCIASDDPRLKEK